MYLFWETIIRPAFETFHPRNIVEVGSEKAFHTRLLLAYCREHDAVLHTIDPTPREHVEEWIEAQGTDIIFHKDLSLNALGRIEEMDTVLIDGDHNWYTVYHELLLLEKYAVATGKFPVVFLHDTQWPYARRDLYYHPETIPEAFRKAYAKKGMSQDSGMLLDEGGLNPTMWHAVEENSLQNGVLTGIEDFLAQSKLQLRFVTVPGLHGLGIIASETVLADYPELSAFLHTLQASPPLKAHMEVMEKERVTTAINLYTLEQEAKKALDLQQAAFDAELFAVEQNSTAALYIAKNEASIALQLAEERLARTLQSVREESEKTIAIIREDSAVTIQKMNDASAAAMELMRSESAKRLDLAEQKYAEMLQTEKAERSRLEDAFNTVRQNYVTLEQAVQISKKEEALWKEKAMQATAALEAIQNLPTWQAKDWMQKTSKSMKKFCKDNGYLIMGDLRRLWVLAGSPFPEFTRAVRSTVFGFFWPVRPENGGSTERVQTPETVTLCLALSGRTWAWPITTRFLEAQTYPHKDIHLCVLDTSQDPAFHTMVGEWLNTCDYGSFAFVSSAAGRKGLADMDRDLRSREVAGVCAKIYQTFASLSKTPTVFILEDDIEPPVDVYARLMQSMGGAIQSAAAWYIHRNSDAVVAWEWGEDGTILDVAPRMGISPIGGNGFGCVVIAGDAFRQGNFDAESPYKHFDFNFYDKLVQKEKKIALIDWSLRCKHYASPTVWK